MSQTRAGSFVCPNCGERMPVTPELRSAVLRNSCPFCVTAVGESDFE